MSIRRTVIYIILLLILALVAYSATVPKAGVDKTIPISVSEQIREKFSPLDIEIADTPELRERGLSNREMLEINSGLLFIFDSNAQYGFWMKDMKFPIDIIWIDENLNIVGVESNISPSTYPKIFYPPTPIRYVLEVNAGEAQKILSK